VACVMVLDIDHRSAAHARLHGYDGRLDHARESVSVVSAASCVAFEIGGEACTGFVPPFQRTHTESMHDQRYGTTDERGWWADEAGRVHAPASRRAANRPTIEGHGENVGERGDTTL